MSTTPPPKPQNPDWMKQKQGSFRTGAPVKSDKPPMTVQDPEKKTG
jgi:hypothetical protein